VADLNPAIREVVDGDLLAGQGTRDVVRLEDEHHTVVLDRQRIGDGPFDAPGKAAVKIVQRPSGLCRSLLFRAGLPKRRL
jgi:hypothetical protein